MPATKPAHTEELKRDVLACAKPAPLKILVPLIRKRLEALRQTCD